MLSISTLRLMFFFDGGQLVTAVTSVTSEVFLSKSSQDITHRKSILGTPMPYDAAIPTTFLPTHL